MRRTIKFRAKTTANGHWVYGSLINYGDGTLAIRNRGSEPWVQAETVGQFTGLLDRNGKEIYEGDLIKCSQTKAIIFEVYYNLEMGAFCFAGHTRDGRFEGITAMGDIFSFNRTMDVVGNIHDNPELLEL